MRAAAVQTAASGPGLLAGLQEQTIPEVPSAALRREWLLAITGGNSDNILKLLEQDPSLMSVADPVMGFTALHWLAKQGQQKTFTEVISRIHEKGCVISVDTRTPKAGLTPLHVAAQQGHVSLVELLLKVYKADTGIRDHSGRKAWQYLPAGTSSELMELAGALAVPGSHGTGTERRAPRRWRQLSVPKFVRRAFSFFRS
ncbi:UNVERIFIED_CONTAM: hypothetical protein H355_005529 [Colinus virginianus]|nr:hypothetical protein H355_005529 [Colinus virginianus]